MNTILPSIIGRAQLDALVTLARSTPLGDFAEVGVFHGGSAQRLYEVAIAQGRRLHLFDTFCGTPNFTPGCDKHKVDAEFADEDAPAKICSAMPAALIYVGIYPATHPSGLSDLAFIHCDCDQYLSYKAVIEQMWPLVVPGGVLLFDDYPYLGGAKKAVEERFTSADLKKTGQRYYVVKSPTCFDVKEGISGSGTLPHIPSMESLHG